MAGTSVRSGLLVIATFFAVFLVFHVIAFPVFWHYADSMRSANGVTRGQWRALKVVFLSLYLGMLALSLALPFVVAKMRHVSSAGLGALAFVMFALWAVISLASFLWLDFMTACSVGHSFFGDVSC